jgi:hypothetical protein
MRLSRAVQRTAESEMLVGVDVLTASAWACPSFVVDPRGRALAAVRVPATFPLEAPGAVAGEERVALTRSNGSPDRKAAARLYPPDERADQGFEVRWSMALDQDLPARL